MLLIIHFIYSTIKTSVNCTGNVVNGTIGKQMVDTLVESASNVEVLTYFFIKVVGIQNN